MSRPRCILCRCEDVTREEFREAYEEGFMDFETLKRYTGVGTGFCQGKACLSEAALELARLRQVAPAAIPLTNIRPPAETLTFGELADLPVPPPQAAPEPGSGTPAGPDSPPTEGGSRPTGGPASVPEHQSGKGGTDDPPGDEP
jgi:bacterioferritin-associated ferredoxin